MAELLADVADAGAAYHAAFLAGLEPEPDLFVWQWAEKNRVLPMGSAEPGPLRMARTPYMREPLEKLSPSDPTDLVVMQKGAQVAASTAAENMVGMIMDHAGGPTMIVRPTEADAKKVSKQRIQPMINTTPSLAEKVATQRARESGNNILEKEFIGGRLVLVGANSPVGMRGMEVRNLILDELDAFPHDVGGEGDPVAVAEKRTNTFGRNRKRFYLSTPTVRGISRIEKEFLATDQRYYHIPCPACGLMQPIRWEFLKWEKDDPDGVVLCCEGCENEIHEHQKPELLEAGRWIATAEANRPNVVGYHLSGLYSPLGWYSWADAVRDFLKAKKEGAESLKAWTNLVLGETWEESGEGIEPEALLARVEEYAAQVPDGVLVLTAGVDVQADRLELEVVGWGLGEESWAIDRRIFEGDPNNNEVWEQLDQVWVSRYEREGGGSMEVAAACVDTGYLTHRVYEYVRTRQSRRIYAVKGVGGSALPFVGAPAKKKTGNDPRPVKVYPLGVDSLKGVLLSRLRLLESGPGCCHWPASGKFNGEYFQQLTAERLITRYTRGVGRKVWQKIRARNEAMDNRNYAYSALLILDPVWDVLARARSAELEAPDDVEETTPTPTRHRRENFVNRYGRRRR